MLFLMENALWSNHVKQKFSVAWFKDIVQFVNKVQAKDVI